MMKSTKVILFCIAAVIVTALLVATGVVSLNAVVQAIAVLPVVGMAWYEEETVARKAKDTTKPARWEPVADLASGSLTERASLYIGVVKDMEKGGHLLSISALGTNGQPYKTILLAPPVRAIDLMRQAVAEFDKVRGQAQAAKKKAGQ